MAISARLLASVAAIVASIATITGVVITVTKHASLDTSNQMSARDAVADHGGQVFQNIGGNVSVGETPSSNPREILARGGTHWTLDDLDAALENNDERVVGLFLAGGMTLRPFQLENFVESGFQPDMADQLVKGIPPDQPSLCPTKDELAIRFYNAARNDKQKLTFVRRLCAGPKVEAAIQGRLKYAEDSIRSLKQKNTAAQNAIDICVKEMHRVGQAKLLSEVSGRPLLMPLFLPSEKESVKTQLSQRLFYGATQGSWFNDAIQEGCSRMHAKTTINETTAEQWREILEWLRG